MSTDPSKLPVSGPTIQRVRELIRGDLRRTQNQAAGDAAALYQPKLDLLTWSPFPFAASCSDAGSGFQVCQYARDAQGTVRLRGLLVFAGTPTNPQLIGNLPVGYRPPASELFAQIGSYSGGNIALRVDVNVGGGVLVNSASGVAWTGGFISLAGLAFGVLP